ncbi:MAG: hypothetical protein H0S85_08490 [Desulfovibrionaceae bacterium]|jgi:hypothetical protein|nr:hypothetical protein [Desulfovibrionaceae bacterium]
MLHGETLHSMLVQDIPWWQPDHFVFFGVLYLVLITVGTGVGLVLLKSLYELHACKDKGQQH